MTGAPYPVFRYRPSRERLRLVVFSTPTVRFAPTSTVRSTTLRCGGVRSGGMGLTGMRGSVRGGGVGLAVVRWGRVGLAIMRGGSTGDVASAVG